MSQLETKTLIATYPDIIEKHKMPLVASLILSPTELSNLL